MVTTSALSQSDADQAAAEDVKQELHIRLSARQSKAPHFVDFVLTQLESMFGPAAVQQGGLVVHTTLDLNLQALAQQSVSQGVHDLQWAKVNNAALLAADPKSGDVLAWVGSADYTNDSIGGQFDVVTAERQPGSSFKPYVYEAALREHVQGYEVFANQGQRVNLNWIKSVDDGQGNVVYQRPGTDTKGVLTQAESYLIADVLRHYQYQWGFGWNRQMASKTGTSDNGHGQIPDSWVMA